MFDLHDRLQTLARSLERVYVEELGDQERFFYANPDGSSTLFLTLREDADRVYGLRLEDGPARPALPNQGWTEVINPSDADEGVLWRAVLASYQAARHSRMAQPTGLLPSKPGKSVARVFRHRA